MIVSRADMMQIEANAFAGGATADALMEQAGAQIAAAVAQFFPQPGTLKVCFGKGHNGGDALVAARYLHRAGWTVEREPAFPVTALADLTRRKLDQLQALGVPRERREGGALVVLDGLLGLGSAGALRGPILAGTVRINELRCNRGAHVVAIDLPTGLDGDTGEADEHCVKADHTFAIGFVKQGLLTDGATNFVGRLSVLPLAGLSEEGVAQRSSSVSTGNSLSGLLPPRRFDLHKGDCGRVAILAGSPGLTGAAIMCAEGALRAGAGLVTLFVPGLIWPVVAAAAPPEVMVKHLDNHRQFAEAKAEVYAIGPGLGINTPDEVLALIRTIARPMVIDADALNILSSDMKVLRGSAGPRLLTPHPGEMARLFPTPSIPRAEMARQFTERFPCTLLLKGARTLVSERGQPLAYNSTGSPAMATGGMGDVLTGVCAGLVAQGLSCYDAARTGAWLCGRAAELALSGDDHTEQTLLATDLFQFFGKAFLDLRHGCF